MSLHVTSRFALVV